MKIRTRSIMPGRQPAIACLPIIVLTVATLLTTGWSGHAAEGWIPLFNGRDFTDLDRYLAAPEGSREPLGLNNDPRGVFRVVQEDGQPAIHISGEIYGALTTAREFGNVHIRVDYKWGPRKWPPRAEPRHHRDSGILYWCVGPHGAGSGAWMRSVESNIMEKSVGQWWSVAGTYCDVEGRNVVLEDVPSIPYRGEGPREECVLWERGTRAFTVKPWQGITSPLDPEKPFGQWNTAEVVAWGPVCIHLLNGKVVLVVTNPRFQENGREQRLSRGRIQLQSEAAELFYRNFEARPLDSIPKELTEYVPTAPQDESGFKTLLGKSGSDGWKQCGPGGFRLENGVATGHGGMGLWWYTNQIYTNFVLRGEWRQTGPKSDSGIFFRFPNPGNDPWIAVRQGHEFEIGEEHAEKPEDATGSFYPFRAADLLPLKPTGEWNSYELTCVGPNYILRVNGRVINTWTDTQNRPLQGYIGIQNYPYQDAVQHRNVRIQPIL